MRRAVRIFVSCAACLVLLAVMAQASTKDKNKKEKGNSAEHHSRMSKVAFWRHHKDSDKKTKSVKTAKVAESKKPSPSNQGQARTAQVKPVSAKVNTSKKDQKQPTHAIVASKKSVTKTKPKQTKSESKTQAPQTVSLKQ